MTQINVEWLIGGIKHTKAVSDSEPVAIGRDPQNDIVLTDPYVSRQHATIIFKNGNFHLQNVSKINPIIFNDNWMLASNLQADLQPGDCFEVGQVRMWVGFNKSPVNGNGHAT